MVGPYLDSPDVVQLLERMVEVGQSTVHMRDMHPLL